MRWHGREVRSTGDWTPRDSQTGSSLASPGAGTAQLGGSMVAAAAGAAAAADVRSREEEEEDEGTAEAAEASSSSRRRLLCRASIWPLSVGLRGANLSWYLALPPAAAEALLSGRCWEGAARRWPPQR